MADPVDWNAFAFDGLAVARNEVPYGETNTGSGAWSVVVQPGQVVQGTDFGNVEFSTASGMKFQDVDGDGTRDGGEPGLDGWIIYADLDDDGIRDVREPFATTAGGGFYTIEGILPGTYKFREELQPAWRQTAPAAGYHEIHFQSGSAITGLDFGNQPFPADWLLAPGDTLFIFGDLQDNIFGAAQDNQVDASVDPTGRLTVTGDSNSFYVFTGIRRIVADMGAGDDRVSLLVPVTGSPIDVELRTDQGDDQVLFENWRGNVIVDLGDGSDMAILNYTGAIGPEELTINVAAGAGDDVVAILIDLLPPAASINLDLDLGDGNDRAYFRNASGALDPADRQLSVAAGSGNDEVNIMASDFSTAFRRIDAGGGNDTLRLAASGLSLDLIALPPATLAGIEQINLTGAAANTLVLNAQHVRDISDTDTLRVRADGSDRVHVGAGWMVDGLRLEAGELFSVFTQAGVTLLVSNLLVGDTDGDQFVARDDAARLLGRFGVPTGADRTSGDMNGDGRVDNIDLAVVQQNLGRRGIVVFDAGGPAASPTAPSPVVVRARRANSPRVRSIARLAAHAVDDLLNAASDRSPPATGVTGLPLRTSRTAGLPRSVSDRGQHIPTGDAARPARPLRIASRRSTLPGEHAASAVDQVLGDLRS